MSSKELSTNQPAERLQDLANYRAFVRYLVYDSQKQALRPTGPYLVRMSPPSDPRGDEQKKDVVIRESLRRYGQDREFILRKIDEELSAL